jgi:hypothetical protein
LRAGRLWFGSRGAERKVEEYVGGVYGAGVSEKAAGGGTTQERWSSPRRQKAVGEQRIHQRRIVRSVRFPGHAVWELGETGARD